ncbi:uncharacterized protein LOC133174166 isoform X2 [Saccostrea echinata]|uniref:uncharacterized protein LOC133174166 isoform X2 n=1 Tax=Saccostrea echinata TaxID=191078 RepID=UPI002A8277BD|nr:uncharacterized protein LOC133174166 isoform X2 [Saccostrea echinata]
MFVKTVVAMAWTANFIKTTFFLCLTVSSIVNCKRSSGCHTKPRKDIYSAEEKCSFAKHSREQKNVRLAEMENKLNNLQRDLENTGKECDLRSESNKQQLEQKMVSLESALNEEKRNTIEIQNNIRRFEEMLKTYQHTGQRTRDMSDKLNLNITLLHSKTLELEKEFTERLDQSSQANNKLKDRIGNLQNIVADNGHTIKIQQELIESLQKKNMEMRESLAHLTGNLSEVRKTAEYFGGKIPDLDSKLTLNDLNIQEMVAYGRFVFVILVLFMVIVYAYRRRMYQEREAKESAPQNNPVPLEPTPGQYKADPRRMHTSKEFPVSRRLENSVGIVSFGESGSDVHREIIDSVISKAKISVRIRHTKVKQEDEISMIPPSKIVFVFVDANSRHIILENPDQEIGDFRRQTTEAILGMGCDVFVLYVRDEGVPGESLYHNRLTSIERHQLLSSLKSKNRVLSLNLALSDYQKRFLTEELQKTFN